MPIITKKPQAQNEQEKEQAVSNQTVTETPVQTEQSEPQYVPESTESVTEQVPPHPQENKTQTTNTNITSNKENTTMNEPTTIRTVSATQTFTKNNETESKLNPMDELIITIEAFKAKLKTMLEESTTMSRKVCEVAIAQKQKEREYARTKRTLDRVRVATGAA